MARSFNGTTDGIAFTDISNTTQLCLSAWINIPSDPTTQFTIIANSDNAGTQRNYAFDYRAGSPFALLLSNTVGGSFGILSVTITLSHNTWYHVGVTVDWTTNPWICKIYVNGVSQTVNASGVTTGIPDVSTTGGIGTLPPLGVAPFNGNIADAAVWNGVLLTQGEMTALSLGARPFNIRAPSRYFPLDGLQSPEPDLSGSAQNGTLTGTALAAGPPVMQFTPRWPQPDTFVAAAAGVKWEIFMRHSLLPMMLAANPSLTRRQAMAALGLA